MDVESSKKNPYVSYNMQTIVVQKWDYKKGRNMSNHIGQLLSVFAIYNRKECVYVLLKQNMKIFHPHPTINNKRTEK